MYIPSIITNLIFIWKLDLKSIYWYSDDYVIKTHKEVSVSRIVKYSYIFLIDLQKEAFLFRTNVVSTAITVLQPIELLYNYLGYPNLENICKPIHMVTGMEICNQHMLDVYDKCTQGKHTIDINYDMTF